MNNASLLSLALTFYPASQEEVKTLYNSYLSQKEKTEQHCVVIKDQSGKLVAGSFGSVTQNSTLHIESVFVEEQFRRAGLGSILLKKLEQEVFKLGACSANLSTFETAAESFILKNNYQIIGSIQNAPIKDRSITYFHKNLSHEDLSFVLPDGLTLSNGSPEDSKALAMCHWKYHFGTSSRLSKETPHKTLSIVAKDKNGSVVGGIVGNINLSDTLFIHCVFVEEPFRRHGLGSKLICELEKLAQQDGAYLSFAKDSLPLFQPLFTKNDYELVGQIEETPVKIRTTYYFKKELKALDHKITVSTDEDKKAAMDAHIAWWISTTPNPEIFPWEMLCFVIKNEEGKIVAGISGGLTLSNTLTIGSLFVDQEYKNKGYESLLLQRIEQAGSAKGAYLSLSLPGMNYISEEQASFFEKQGYARIIEKQESAGLSFFKKEISNQSVENIDSNLKVGVGTATDAAFLSEKLTKYDKLEFAIKSSETVKLLGNIVGSVVGQALFPEDLYIFEKKQGLGSILLKKLEDEAFAKNARTVLFFTPNESSALFYKKNGYLEVGTIDNAPYFGNKIFLLKKNL